MLEVRKSAAQKRNIKEKTVANITALMLQKLSIDEIQTELNKEGGEYYVKQYDGKPLKRIRLDRILAEIHERWRQQTDFDLQYHFNRQYYELQEVKRAMWKTNDYRGVLKALAQEMDLLGTARKGKGHEEEFVDSVLVVVEDRKELVEFNEIKSQMTGPNVLEIEAAPITESPENNGCSKEDTPRNHP